MPNGRRATVIGGRGFIGRHLVARLIAEGWDCRVPTRNAHYGGPEDMGIVFYCAGLTADYVLRPFDTVDAHVSVLKNVLQKGRFKTLVYLSSTRLYDSQASGVGTEDAPLLLNPTNPRHSYDLSKALGESLCRVAADGRAKVARLSCVYQDHNDEDGFLPSLLRRVIEAINSKDFTARPCELKVDSSATFARDYVHLADVMDALMLMASRGSDFIYNVASGENVSNGALFSTISEITGCEIVPLRNDSPTSPARVSVSKLQNEFAWHPVPVLEKVVAMLREHVHAKTS